MKQLVWSFVLQHIYCKNRQQTYWLAFSAAISTGEIQNQTRVAELWTHRHTDCLYIICVSQRSHDPLSSGQHTGQSVVSLQWAADLSRPVSSSVNTVRAFKQVVYSRQVQVWNLGRPPGCRWAPPAVETRTLIKVNFSSLCLLLCRSLVPLARFSFVFSAVLIFQNKSRSIKQPSLIPGAIQLRGVLEKCPWRARRSQARLSSGGGPRTSQEQFVTNRIVGLCWVCPMQVLMYSRCFWKAQNIFDCDKLKNKYSDQNTFSGLIRQNLPAKI